nr:transposon TX1 uncharacterized [Tanacetum cinerariifolium]
MPVLVAFSPGSLGAVRVSFACSVFFVLLVFMMLVAYALFACLSLYFRVYLGVRVGSVYHLPPPYPASAGLGIKRAGWNCGSGKAPSLDGFTFKFIKLYWETIGKDFVEMVKRFEADLFQEGGSVQSNKLALVALKKVCSPSTRGELGIGSLQAANLAMLANGDGKFTMIEMLYGGTPSLPFMSDNWLGNYTLRSLFPRLFSLEAFKECKDVDTNNTLDAW